MELAYRIRTLKMSDKKQRPKRLSQILQANKYFDRAVELYIDQLRKKRDWQNLENKMVECKNIGWNKEKLRKIFQWERKASEMHSKSLDASMEVISHMALEITDEQFSELKEWIKNNPHSKKAWNKNIISLDDPLPIIRAKIMHLAYMRRSPIPVNIGEMIKN